MIRTSTSSKSDLHFDYDAMGQRICKIVKPRDPAIGLSDQNAWTYTYYLRDAQGNVIATYDRDFTSPATYYYDQLTVKENHLYGSSRVGVKSDTLRVASVKYNYISTSNHVYSGTVNTRTSVAAQTNAFVHALGRRSYELVNHLGNVLVTVSDARTATNGVGAQSGIVVSFNAVVNSATDYYAFGSPMEGRSYSSASYRYGFNGKENDPEAVGTGEGLQDYGMRIYNPGLGRFLSIDPISPDYPWYSPYHFAGDKPIGCTDLDGAEENCTATNPSKFTGCGNVMIIVMDGPDHTLYENRKAELDASGWDYVCVNSLSEADAWVHANYADGTVNNLYIQMHSCENPQTCEDGSALLTKDPQSNIDQNRDAKIPVTEAEGAHTGSSLPVYHNKGLKVATSFSNINTKSVLLADFFM